MGCYHCKSAFIDEDRLISSIVVSIENDDVLYLKNLVISLAFGLQKDILEIIDARLISKDAMKFSMLGYCVYAGKAKCYNFLIEKMNASVILMEESLEKENLNSLMLICKNGYLDLLKIYLPYYANAYNNNKNTQDRSYTLDLANSMKIADDVHSPIQVACFKGHLNLIIYLQEYFNDINIPTELDIHHIDEISGENCALISVRTGNFPLMKLLYEKFHSNFHIKNKRNEGCLQIIAAASKDNFALHYIECIMYLVEVINVDIQYMHEEILLLIEDKIIVRYFEEKLKGSGILVTKMEMEALYKMKHEKKNIG